MHSTKVAETEKLQSENIERLYWYSCIILPEGQTYAHDECFHLAQII